MDSSRLAELAPLGFHFVADFVTAAEEAELLSKLIMRTVRGVQSHAGRNCVQRYGSSAPYNNHMVSDVIPPHFAALCQRLVDQQLVAHRPDSVTVNEYLRGQVIKAHVDALGGGPVITILSLGTPATMRFRRKNVDKFYDVVLTPRSLIQMRDDLRYKWTHEILPVANARYSAVFRCSKECPPDTTETM
jgi:alkylated DNA repair dioxygenase AlkB